ncbi:hypothetical protein HYC85_012066 [Camellia sinensis]|uniref:Uncharacterized protein n=1 Tax=Camellia sinensis TaxID=4442 RepID=A0A7J7HAV7_CAMSI|nr:hypothetical protein HYC85_012066 [Camellia sinensis]
MIMIKPIAQYTLVFRNNPPLKHSIHCSQSSLNSNPLHKAPLRNILRQPCQFMSRDDRV